MDGICIQILSSLAAYNSEPERCSKNDCKVVISHLIRKFREPLQRAHPITVYCSNLLANYTGPIREDHVIPVKAIMDRLFHLNTFEFTDENILNIRTMLTQHTLSCRITVAEDNRLNAAGFQSK